MLAAFTRKRRQVLILILVLTIAILTWLYWLYRPPYSLYNYLTDEEVRSAQWALALGKKEQESQENKSGKFVLFNQLQGAGFNNQVRICLFFIDTLLIVRCKKFSSIITLHSLRPARIYISLSSGDHDSIKLFHYPRSSLVRPEIVVFQCLSWTMFAHRMKRYI